jgi:hypothetical protein
MPHSLHETLGTLAAIPITRPPGLLEELHNGFAMRYGGYCAYRTAALEWIALDEMADELDRHQLDDVLPTLDQRAWEAGSHGAVRLATRLWSWISSPAKGQFLAGAARHLSRKRAEEGANKLADFLVENLAAAQFEPQGAAEIAANAIRADWPVLLDAIMAHPDFNTNAIIERLYSDSNWNRFSDQVSQHATRTLDVLLETAVRCLRPDTTKQLLEVGACPDLPCWNLERSFSDWFSLLSYSLYSLWESEDRDAAMRIFDLLLEHGANPLGLPCEGLNHPLKLALDNRCWDIAHRLLDLGAGFDGGRHLTAEDFEKPGRLIPAGHPHFGVFDDDLRWVEEKIAPLMPLLKPWQTALFYKGNSQGGSSSTFLSSLLAEEHLEQLKHFEKRGMPTRLTPALVIEIVKWGRYSALLHLLRHEPNLPRLMFRIRRRNPKIGTSGLQAWLCQPQEDRANELPGFAPGAQEPLVLPDGSRFYFFLDAVAPPDHRHGPITGGCFWLEEPDAEHRRRRNQVQVRVLKRIWRMTGIPDNDYQLAGMIPILKEVNGRCFLPGISARHMQFGQHFPEGWKARVDAWLEQPFERAKEQFRQRILDQLATTPLMPDPVLNPNDLEPYPREFWPWLRRLPDGFIGMSEESCRKHPDILDIYTVWERQNKPPRDFIPDARVSAWPLWQVVPIELRPFFVWDDLFHKPSVSYKARNDYEQAMVRKAVNWNNDQFINLLKDAGL